MTMDEVNEKFPMMKYKGWVSERAREGLPTAGGVSLPASRAQSLREVDAIVGELASKERHSTSDHPRPRTAEAATTGDADAGQRPLSSEEEPKEQPQQPNLAGQTSTTEASRPQELRRIASEEDDEDEHINAALPPDCIAAPGDSCAICIDTLEDDDDVRGLTCGHAFHAVCLDPWLTSRRACCPLCKADYYVPKPRPNPENIPNLQNPSLDPRLNSRLNLPTGLSLAWFRGGSGNQSNGFFRFPGDSRRLRNERGSRNQTETHAQGGQGGDSQNPQQPSTTEVTESSGGGFISSVRRALPFGRRRNEQQPAGQAASGSASDGHGPAPNVTATPSELEAGRGTANAASQ